MGADNDLATRMRQLEAENQEMRNYISAIEKWKDEGERLFESSKRRSKLFAAGAWWADRPWRRRSIYFGEM